MSDPVPALIPLSLLEAIRNLDTLPGNALEDIVGDELTRRLGISGTVAAQIGRYLEATEARGTVGHDEALGVFRLVGRRTDHALCFADAGRRAARYAAVRHGRTVQRLLGVRRAGLGRRTGIRAATRDAEELFGATLLVTAGGIAARSERSLAIEALPDGEGCAFYAACFAELLRVLTGFEGAFFHDACRSRGDQLCLWSAVPAEETE